MKDKEKPMYNAHKPLKEGNHYEILGLENNASAEEITKQFRKLAVIYNPDKLLSDINKGDRGGREPTESERRVATQNFQKLNDAHDILTDPDKRAEYDRQLAQEGKYKDPELSVNELYEKIKAGYEEEERIKDLEKKVKIDGIKIQALNKEIEFAKIEKRETSKLENEQTELIKLYKKSSEELDIEKPRLKKIAEERISFSYDLVKISTNLENEIKEHNIENDNMSKSLKLEEEKSHDLKIRIKEISEEIKHKKLMIEKNNAEIKKKEDEIKIATDEDPLDYKKEFNLWEENMKMTKDNIDLFIKINDLQIDSIKATNELASSIKNSTEILEKLNKSIDELKILTERSNKTIHIGEKLNNLEEDAKENQELRDQEIKKAEAESKRSPALSKQNTQLATNNEGKSLKPKTYISPKLNFQEIRAKMENLSTKSSTSSIDENNKKTKIDGFSTKTSKPVSPIIESSSEAILKQSPNSNKNTPSIEAKKAVSSAIEPPSEEKLRNDIEKAETSLKQSTGGKTSSTGETYEKLKSERNENISIKSVAKPNIQQQNESETMKGATNVNMSPSENVTENGSRSKSVSKTTNPLVSQIKDPKSKNSIIKIISKMGKAFRSSASRGNPTHPNRQRNRNM